MPLKTVMEHKFSQIPSVSIPRSVFDRSHGYKTTFDAGFLIPILTDEVLPGDTFNLQTSLFARLATPIFPIMDNMYLETQFWFVPNRLLWDNWQKFNGERKNPGDSIDFSIPQMVTTGTGFVEGELGDYFGLPTAGSVMSVSSLHFRAYNLIYNEWYRDQNLQASVTVDLDDGPDSISNYKILKRGKRHDYFTSSVPQAQKGTAVALPLGTSAPVKGDGNTLGLSDGTSNQGLFSESTGNLREISASTTLFDVAIGAAVGTPGAPTNNVGIGVTTDATKSGLVADLSTATAATINQLREAFMIQSVLEKDMRGGTRYTEMIKSHFGVTNPDFRLQRPEYLGGGSTRVNINPVQQTSSTDATSPQGNLAGFGTASMSGHSFNKSFTEHGVIIGIANVRADLTYQQGIPRMWSRTTRFDFYLPSLAHLGEQVVFNQEIFWNEGLDNPLGAFGFQERWAEYRYKQSQITGLFRGNAAGTLQAWHMSELFGSLPTLGNTFIKDQTTNILDSRVAVPSEPDFLLDCYFSMKCARPMPVYSVPGLSQHF